MEDRHQGQWEKRWHPLREEWIVYSAPRNSRPWQGAGLVKPAQALSFDPLCYLCPGNKRVNGSVNPDYSDVFIFENDLPVVGKQAPEVPSLQNTIHKKSRALGIAKVVCYDPRHYITLSQMKLRGVTKVLQAFQREMIGFEKDPDIQFALIFENKGEAVGVSNPHPHCQIYATDFTFKLVEQQIRLAYAHQVQHRKNLFDEIVANEIFSDAHRHSKCGGNPNRGGRCDTGNTQPVFKELVDLASVFQQVTRRMDMNFNISFPYVMTVMQSPVDGGDYRQFRMHFWFQPPYRQPGLIKYLAGPEIGGGNFMADTMPEEKAAELREIDLRQYADEQ